MPAERYYFEGDFNSEYIFLEGTEYHHLFKVMRGKQGDPIEIINGKGFLAEGSIEEISRKNAKVKINTIHFEHRPHPRIILAQAVPRINRLDNIVEKCTELGMQELWLFPGILSERKELTDHQLERLRNLAIAAIKQSGRLWLPEIKWMPPLLEWKENVPKGFFGDVLASEENYLIRILQNKKFDDKVIFFIGPESGFDPREEEKLKQMGMQGVRLLDAILRTDTASMVAISTIMSVSLVNKFHCAG